MSNSFMEKDYLGPPPGLGSVVIVRPKVAEAPVLNEGSVFKIRPKLEHESSQLKAPPVAATSKKTDVITKKFCCVIS